MQARKQWKYCYQQLMEADDANATQKQKYTITYMQAHLMHTHIGSRSAVMSINTHSTEEALACSGINVCLCVLACITHQENDCFHCNKIPHCLHIKSHKSQAEEQRCLQIRPPHCSGNCEAAKRKSRGGCKRARQIENGFRVSVCRGGKDKR